MSRFDDLIALEAALGELVSRLGDVRTSNESLTAAWERCRAHDGLVEGLAQEELEGLEGLSKSAWLTRLKAVATLNALALGTGERAGSEVLRGLDKLRRARHNLSRLKVPAAPGESCDVNG